MFVLFVFVAFALCTGSIALAQQQNNVPPQGQVAEEPDAAASPDDKAGANPDEKTIQMSDIHDIRPPEEIGFDLMPLYYALGGALVLILVCLIVLFFKKRGKRLKQKNIIKLSPDELAFASLDNLKDIENMDGREFYFQVSAILRTYIQGQYDINAPEMTTEELLSQIDKLRLDKALHKDTRAWLSFAEPIKFAKAIVSADKMGKDLAFVRRFVEQTKTVINEQ